MLSAIALVALLAEPNAAHIPTVTTKVSASEMKLWHSRLGDMPPPPRHPDLATTLGDFASALSCALKRRGASLGIEGGTFTPPPWVPGGKTSNGWLAPGIAQGLYFGHAPLPQTTIFPERETNAARPSLRLPGTHVRMDASIFFTSVLGIRVDLSMGQSMYGAVSLVYRPKW